MRQSIIILTIVLSIATTAFSQSSRRSSVINGHVVTDDGQPASDAQIFAVPAGGQIRDLIQTVCDEEGNFKLTSVRSGAYVIRATSPGYVTPNSENRIYRSGENVLINLIKGGVITGRVTDALGEPVVGLKVQAQMVRDLEGRRGSRLLSNPAELVGHSTDDRGIYRIYGLDPGVYLVKASGGKTSLFQAPMGSATREVPTYYPSSTYDTAVEVTIRGGEEVSGIDIRHRGERGYAVSGTLAGEVESNNFFNAVVVGLRNPVNGNMEAMTAGIASGKFSILGVPNGEYEIVAFRNNESNDRAESIPRRVTVRGADVGGIELRLVKLASIGGRFVIETVNPNENCAKEEPAVPEDFTLRTKRSDRAQPTTPIPSDFSWGLGGGLDFSVPNDKGEFVLKNLEAGRHHIVADLPGETYYVRSITQNASSPARRTAASVDLARNGITLRYGESIMGVKIAIAPGAASLRGRIANNDPQAGAASSAKPARMRILLIPAEPTAADDVIRYYESLTRGDGSFEIKHLAPGKYLTLARPVAENDLADAQDRQLAWDATERAKLRRDAQAAKNEIELKPCGRVTDYVLRY